MSLAQYAQAATPQLVPWALRTTVDTDGDGTNDLFDNAPGAFDPSQVDTDADLIGDIIDPTPSNSNPALGDPGLGFGGPYTINSGANVSIDYLMVLQTPPGAWGYIDLDLGGNGVYDATYFGPLTASTNQIVIPAGMFELPGLYSQTVPGSYTIFAKAFGPGMHSQFETITNVNVIPEPAAALLFAVGSLIAFKCRRRSS
ncbi:MAG: hypothetical protein U0805_21475 [Pirellulales bacterium]